MRDAHHAPLESFALSRFQRTAAIPRQIVSGCFTVTGVNVSLVSEEYLLQRVPYPKLTCRARRLSRDRYRTGRSGLFQNSSVGL